MESKNISNQRKTKDLTKLLVKNYDVKIIDEKTNSEFFVKFEGPINSPYEGVSILFIICT